MFSIIVRFTPPDKKLNKNNPGREGVSLAMNIIGIDIGGTKISVVQSDPTGEILFKKVFPSCGPEEFLEKLFRLTDSLIDESETVFGISCGGPLDTKAGVILSPPNLPGWDAVPVVERITGQFGGQAFLMNDANAGALAQWQYGAGKGYRSLVFLTHGTGMGAGLILDGRLYEGTGGDAGEVGHIRLSETGPEGYGKKGSFEGFCSGGGIARLTQLRLHGKKTMVNNRPLEGISAADVFAAARAGNSDAVAVVEESAAMLGRGLAMIVDMLNPEVIILGSIYTRSGDLLEEKMMKVLSQEALPHALKRCLICPAQLGEKAGDLAAISVALYKKGYFNSTE